MPIDTTVTTTKLAAISAAADARVQTRVAKTTTEAALAKAQADDAAAGAAIVNADNGFTAAINDLSNYLPTASAPLDAPAAGNGTGAAA